jgi:glycerol-3-phosphate acyltransferase PlsY
MRVALVLIAAYLLGSIPFSYLVARRWGIRDVRQVGSGNVGASNVMRAAGVLPGLLALLLDALKGGAAAMLAQRLDLGNWLPAGAASLAVVGHLFPVWIGFRGGKGVATGAGAFLPLAPLAAGAGLLSFGLALVATRYVSVSSLAGTATLAAATFALGSPAPVCAAAVVVASLIFWRHRGNLERLRAGSESRMGRRQPPPAGSR